MCTLRPAWVILRRGLAKVNLWLPKLLVSATLCMRELTSLPLSWMHPFVDQTTPTCLVTSRSLVPVLARRLPWCKLSRNRAVSSP